MAHWRKSRPEISSPRRAPTPRVSPAGGAEADPLGGRSSGKPAPALSEFGSQEVDWQPHSGPLAISGKTPGTSLSQMISLPKILTRNLSLTRGQVVDARNELSEEARTSLPAPRLLS